MLCSDAAPYASACTGKEPSCAGNFNQIGTESIRNMVTGLVVLTSRHDGTRQREGVLGCGRGARRRLCLTRDEIVDDSGRDASFKYADCVCGAG